MENKFDFFMPTYLKHDFDALIDGIKNKVSYVDCLLDELENSVKVAHMEHSISDEETELLRKEFELW